MGSRARCAAAPSRSSPDAVSRAGGGLCSGGAGSNVDDPGVRRGATYRFASSVGAALRGVALSRGHDFPVAGMSWNRYDEGESVVARENMAGCLKGDGDERS